MIQTSQKLINLPVISESGQKLGYLVDFNIETESQSIISYLVHPHSLVADLLNNELIINRGQIVDIKKDSIIVSDNVVKSQSQHQSIRRKEKKVVSVTEKNI